METSSRTQQVNETVAWHALATDDVVKQLATRIDKGLDSAEASIRLQKHGPNLLPLSKKQSSFMRFLLQFNNVLVYVLIGAGLLKLALGLWLDASIILAVVFLNALLGFIQEGKAAEALESIGKMLSVDARAVRDGETRMIAADTLVPGDVVLLESGDKVPADLRLVDVKNLRTEEAALTGESVPADKSTQAVESNATVGDRESMVFSGTMVVSGRATGVVVATGSHTELGRINALLANVNTLETPLLRQIKKFGTRSRAPSLSWGHWFSSLPAWSGVWSSSMFSRPSSVSPFRLFQKAFLPSLRSRWPLECSAWPSATRSFAVFLRWRRLARCHASARTRPAP